MPPPPWPFSSQEDARVAATILGALLIALLGWLGTRLYQIGQKRDLLAHLGIEVGSNAAKLHGRVGIPVVRTAWSDHRVRGIFKWQDTVEIEAAYSAGDQYNEHIIRRANAVGEQARAEDTAIRESAAAALAAFKDAAQVISRYGWPK